MKTLNLIALMVLCFLSSLNAQDTIQKIKIYRTWVSSYNELFITKGVLYEIKDSSISLSNSLVKQDYSSGKFEISNFQINNIETIKTRRNGNIGIGIFLGALTGFAIGGLIGFISGDDPKENFMGYTYSWFTAEEKALMYGIPLAIGGAGIGALIGSIKVKIPINGSFDDYNRNKDKLRKYSIKKN
ncbi:MAG: hypothetical protein NT175_07065 [Bacteroidetes bacterium]|nr:hypothetical protein [Bacteroidota bacterium]